MMPRFRNVDTGVVVSTDDMTGVYGAWEPIKDEAPAKAEKDAAKKAAPTKRPAAEK